MAICVVLWGLLVLFYSCRLSFHLWDIYFFHILLLLTIIMSIMFFLFFISSMRFLFCEVVVGWIACWWKVFFSFVLHGGISFVSVYSNRSVVLLIACFFWSMYFCMHGVLFMFLFCFCHLPVSLFWWSLFTCICSSISYS